MEKLKVKNSKNFALTNDKEYEVISKDGSRIEVKNDKGNRAFYYPSIFEAAAPPAPAITLQTILDSISVTAQRVRFNVGTTNIHITCTLNNTEASNSCGIREINGINELYEFLEDKVENESIAPLTAEERRIVVLALFKAKLNQRVNLNDGAMALISTNTNFSNFSEIDSIVNETFPNNASLLGENPNSANEIKTWLVPIN